MLNYLYIVFFSYFSNSEMKNFACLNDNNNDFIYNWKPITILNSIPFIHKHKVSDLGNA